MVDRYFKRTERAKFFIGGDEVQTVVVCCRTKLRDKWSLAKIDPVSDLTHVGSAECLGIFYSFSPSQKMLDFETAVKQEEERLFKETPKPEDVPTCTNLLDQFFLCYSTLFLHLCSQSTASLTND